MHAGEAPRDLGWSQFVSAISLPVGRPGWAPAPKEIASTSLAKEEDDLFDAKEDSGNELGAQVSDCSDATRLLSGDLPKHHNAGEIWQFLDH